MTLQEAADRLGVHYMTAYRYVRLGLLDARKDGGVWRVEETALAAFRAHAARPHPRGRVRRAPWAERLADRLLAGDTAGAWQVVEAALAAGASVEDVYLDVLTRAAAAICLTSIAANARYATQPSDLRVFTMEPGAVVAEKFIPS